MTTQASPGLVRAVNFLDRHQPVVGPHRRLAHHSDGLSLVWEVVARYFFNAPTIWAYDMTYMLYGSFFMLGLRLHAAARKTYPHRQSLRAMVAAPPGTGRYRLLSRFLLPALDRSALCDLGLFLAVVHARGTGRIQPVDADHLSAEIHDAGDLHPSAAAGCRRVPAFVARRNDGRVAAGPVVDAASG